jgi:hypothetical protein
MWDNSDTLRGLSHTLMWASAILAIMAAVATGVRYYVDRRIGELSAQARAVEERIRDQAQSESEAELRSELQVADLRLKESEELARAAERTADELKKGAAPRRLTAPQRDTILKAVTPYAGQSCLVVFVNGEPDAERFAQDFAEVLQQAHWTRTGEVKCINFTKDPIGVEVTLNIEYMEKHLAPPAAAEAIATALVEAGLAQDTTLFVNPQTPTGVVEVRVGHKPIRPGVSK